MRYIVVSLADIRNQHSLRDLLLTTCTIGREGDMYYALTQERITGKALLMQQGEEILGWSLLWGDETCPMLDVFVKPDHRRCGYGRDLVSRLRGTTQSDVIVSEHAFFEHVFAGKIRSLGASCYVVSPD